MILVFILEHFFSVENGENLLYYKKEKLEYTCHEDGVLLDMSYRNFSSKDVVCRHPQMCFGQNISNAIEDFRDNKTLDFVSNKEMFFFTFSRFRHSYVFRQTCYIGGKLKNYIR